MGHRPHRPRPPGDPPDRDQGDDGLRFEWAIRTPGEFDAVLEDLCQPIPGRGPDQTTQARERWTLGHALKVDRAVFGSTLPVQIAHQDAPDFVLHHGSGSVGVEVVEAIPRQLAHAYAVVNAAIEAGEPVPDVMSFRHLQSERKSTTRKEILDSIDPRNSDPWLGDEAQRHWLDVMRRVIADKCFKASRYGNRENLHLLISDEVASCADPERAWPLLQDQHDLMAASGAVFAAIHILSQRRLYSRRFA